MEFLTEYGLIAAGAVNSSFIGRLPGISRGLGPVAGVSYRVASRIANTLRAGRAVRSPGELNSVRLILLHSSADQHEPLIEVLKGAGIQWAGKSLLFCDSDLSGAEYFREAGASVTRLSACAIPGRMVLEGANPSLALAHRLVRGLRLKAIEIDTRCTAAFENAVLLGTGALTPLIDRAAGMLRQCGMRDGEAMRVAASLFERTSKEYAHSGRQSWAWYSRTPEIETVLRQLETLPAELKSAVALLIAAGLDGSGRHEEIARRIRDALKA